MNSRITLAAVAAAASLFFSTDSAAQAKSNIQDDPKSSSCTENCVDAGYEWAVANEPTGVADCGASNSDFAEGCDHWLNEQAELNGPPPEEPAEPSMDDSAAPMPMDDSAAPVPNDEIPEAPADNASDGH